MNLLIPPPAPPTFLLQEKPESKKEKETLWSALGIEKDEFVQNAMNRSADCTPEQLDFLQLIQEGEEVDDASTLDLLEHFLNPKPKIQYSPPIAYGKSTEDIDPKEVKEELAMGIPMDSIITMPMLDISSAQVNFDDWLKKKTS